MTQKILIVFDLDGTLIHSIEDEDVDMTADLRHSNFNTWFREGAIELIERLQKSFHVGVWTAATEDYAKPIVEKLFFKQQPFIFRTRKNCSTRFGGFYSSPLIIKRLKNINYPLKLTLIVDDTPETYSENYGNAIPISSWEGEVEEGEHILKNLGDYLEETFSEGVYYSVRSVDKQCWEQGPVGDLNI